MNREESIGCSQRVQLEWLDLTAQLYSAGYTKSHIQETLQTYLKDYLSVGSNTRSGNRALTIGILTKTWVAPPKNIEQLRDEGLQLLEHATSIDRLVLHWGVMMAVYPFFFTIAETVGRLNKIQETISAIQVQKRMCEQYGDRSTVERATRRLLRSFIDWGVLLDTNDKGIYKTPPAKSINDIGLACWLVEASLLAKRSSSGMLKSLIQHPALFPFETPLVNARMLEKHQRIEVFRQGVDEEVVMLLH